MLWGMHGKIPRKEHQEILWRTALGILQKILRRSPQEKIWAMPQGLLCEICTSENNPGNSSGNTSLELIYKKTMVVEEMEFLLHVF